MKQVKFRGKSLKTGDWIYGDIIQKPMHNGTVQYKIWDHSPHAGIARVMPESVGQFIGMYDKNGKEMYVGDIIMFWRPAIYPEERGHNGDVTDHYVKCLGVIDFNFLSGAHALYFDARHKMWMPACLYTTNDMEDIKEVAGNVIDNPTLLQI